MIAVSAPPLPTPAEETPRLDEALATLRAWQEASGLAELNGRGLEAIIAGATLAVSKKTWLLPGKRERGCALLRGCSPEKLDEARPYRVVPAGSSPAQRALQGVGLAMTGDPALVFLGTGSTSYGAFHEALNLAALNHVAVTLVVGWYENEGPFATQVAVSPASLARAYGFSIATVDGADVEAVYAAVAAAEGMALIEARLRGRD